jgi:membrane-associated phospholipid phosphatase
MYLSEGSIMNNEEKVQMKVPGRAGGILRNALAMMGPDFALVGVFFTTLVVLIAGYGAQFRWTEGPIVISGGILVGLIAIALLTKLPSILRRVVGAWQDFYQTSMVLVRDWGPFILLMWAFQSLETYTGVIRKVPIDDALYRLDLAWFGVEPTVWAYKFHNPLLTDWMSFSYGSYFVMPMIIAASLSLRGRRADFREMSTAMVLQLGIGFILFLIFPAGPPRYYQPLLDGPFQQHIHSFFGLFEFQQGAFDSADPVRTRSAFPSLHCSLGVLTITYAWKFGNSVFSKYQRLIFWIFLPVVVSLWVSTIYLRHHWVPDCLAGMAIGFAASVIAANLRKYWPTADFAHQTQERVGLDVWSPE